MCCSVVDLARYVSVLGILVSGMCIAPPTYTYITGRDHSTLIPGIHTLQVGSISHTTAVITNTAYQIIVRMVIVVVCHWFKIQC